MNGCGFQSLGILLCFICSFPLNISFNCHAQYLTFYNRKIFLSFLVENLNFSKKCKLDFEWFFIDNLTLSNNYNSIQIKRERNAKKVLKVPKIPKILNTFLKMPIEPVSVTKTIKIQKIPKFPKKSQKVPKFQSALSLKYFE